MKKWCWMQCSHGHWGQSWWWKMWNKRKDTEPGPKSSESSRGRRGMQQMLKDRISLQGGGSMLGGAATHARMQQWRSSRGASPHRERRCCCGSRCSWESRASWKAGGICPEQAEIHNSKQRWEICEKEEGETGGRGDTQNAQKTQGCRKCILGLSDKIKIQKILMTDVQIYVVLYKNLNSISEAFLSKNQKHNANAHQ